MQTKSKLTVCNFPRWTISNVFIGFRVCSAPGEERRVWPVTMACPSLDRINKTETLFYIAINAVQGLEFTARPFLPTSHHSVPMVATPGISIPTDSPAKTTYFLGIAVFITGLGLMVGLLVSQAEKQNVYDLAFASETALINRHLEALRQRRDWPDSTSSDTADAERIRFALDSIQAVSSERVRQQVRYAAKEFPLYVGGSYLIAVAGVVLVLFGRNAWVRGEHVALLRRLALEEEKLRLDVNEKRRAVGAPEYPEPAEQQRLAESRAALDRLIRFVDSNPQRFPGAGASSSASLNAALDALRRPPGSST